MCSTKECCRRDGYDTYVALSLQQDSDLRQPLELPTARFPGVRWPSYVWFNRVCDCALRCFGFIAFLQVLQFYQRCSLQFLLVTVVTCVPSSMSLVKDDIYSVIQPCQQYPTDLSGVSAIYPCGRIAAIAAVLQRGGCHDDHAPERLKLRATLLFCDPPAFSSVRLREDVLVNQVFRVCRTPAVSACDSIPVRQVLPFNMRRNYSLACSVVVRRYWN